MDNSAGDYYQRELKAKFPLAIKGMDGQIPG